MSHNLTSLGLAALAIIVVAAPVVAKGPPPMSPTDRKRINAEMMKLDFSTRIEQRCNARAMGIVRREHWPMNPDEGAVRAFAEPVGEGTRLSAEGAAIRSDGAWYRIAFDCETSDDGLEIKFFRYSLGPSVPRAEWKDHDLVEP